jgi:hypothetical protein
VACIELSRELRLAGEWLPRPSGSGFSSISGGCVSHITHLAMNDQHIRVVSEELPGEDRLEI